ncbi:helix-turn-helix transcriptional regulator [Halosegnis marinus]|uniref:Helix-turn-helix transcriptional regulator n=1 Tax=Halosegnis marinus TaxID=3034023 RepID=A0ABD5ZSB4_9EURY|nr:MarR family transcriptional regulator [Halosegnis sp. DT85]
MPEELTDDEERAMELIAREGGIHQSDFWKELDVDSRKGSRIAESLAEKGYVEREETLYEGHNTYFIEPVVHAEELDFSLLMAGDMLSPFVGDEEADPNADRFSQWVMTLAYR